MKIATLQQVAKICGVSRTAVHYAIEAGRCPAVVVKGKKRVDLHDVGVSQYIEDTKSRKAEEEAKLAKPKAKPGPKPAAKPALDLPVPFAPPLPPPMDFSDAQPLVNSGVSSRDVKMRKAVADAALQEMKLRLSSADYFQKLGAVVDIESLRRKMGKFEDVLITHLIYMPEEIADQLWIAAKASDDPPKLIREYLADKIGVVVREAKLAVRDIVPEVDKVRKYVIIDDKSEEG